MYFISNNHTTRPMCLQQRSCVRVCVFKMPANGPWREFGVPIQGLKLAILARITLNHVYWYPYIYYDSTRETYSHIWISQESILQFLLNLRPCHLLILFFYPIEFWTSPSQFYPGSSLCLPAKHWVIFCHYQVHWNMLHHLKPSWVNYNTKSKAVMCMTNRRVIQIIQHYESTLLVYNNAHVTLTSSWPRNTEATAVRACSGQGINQSMLQLLTRPGKLRQRVLKTSPTGDMASTMCRLLAHLLTKYCQMASLVGGTPCLVASSRVWI